MGITLGIREQYALASLFMLTWATQTYGFLTEYISTPKAYTDQQNYKYPVGPYQLQKFAEGAADYGVTDYYRDPAALKLIDQTEWEAVRCIYLLASHTRTGRAPIQLAGQICDPPIVRIAPCTASRRRPRAARASGRSTRTCAPSARPTGTGAHKQRKQLKQTPTQAHCCHARLHF